MKDELIKSALTIIMGLVCLWIIISLLGFNSKRFYEVKTRISIGNCSNVENLYVEASSSSEAKRIATRVHQLKAQVRVLNYKEVNR